MLLELLCPCFVCFCARFTVFGSCIHNDLCLLGSLSCLQEAVKYMHFSTTSVTNLNLKRHPVKIGGSDLVQPITTVTLREEENSLWKMTLPPTRDQIC